MVVLLIILAVLVWGSLGVWAYVYYITRTHDVTTSDSGFLVFAFLAGPAGWVATAVCLMGKHTPSKILFKKKEG